MYKSDSTSTVHRRANKSQKNNEHEEEEEGLDKSDHIIIQKDTTVGEKLFQAKEDRLFAHKIIGFSVLASYIYRFSNLGDRDGNFNASLLTVVFVLHHLFLNISSFVFEIPKRRIRGGFRIWPEYRIHSLVFTARNLACIVRLWLIQRYFSGTTLAGNDSPLGNILDNGMVNWVIVIATCAAADYGSSLSRQYQSNTVRGTDYFDPYANWFASEMQFQLTAICLSGVYQRYSLHLVGAFVIQFNSFLMTLRRKNVFSHLVLTTTYGIVLVFALLIGVYEDFFTEDQVTKTAVFANLGVVLRMGMGVDKYLVWTILAVAMHHTQKNEEHILMTLIPGASTSRDPEFYWTLAFWATKFFCLGLGVRKRSKALRKHEEIDNEVGNGIILAFVVLLSALMAYDMLDIFGILE